MRRSNGNMVAKQHANIRLSVQQHTLRRQYFMLEVPSNDWFLPTD